MAASDHLNDKQFSLPPQQGTNLRYHLSDYHGYGPAEIGMVSDAELGTLHDSTHATPDNTHNHNWVRPE